MIKMHSQKGCVQNDRLCTCAIKVGNKSDRHDFLKDHFCLTPLNCTTRL